MNLTKKEVERLKVLLTMYQEDLYDSIIDVLKLSKLEYIESRYDYIIIPGKAPVCVVSHLDTASHFDSYPTWDEIIQTKNTLHLCQRPITSCLGGDDRCGVFIALFYLLPLKQRPTLVFTCDEETGCRGSRTLTQHLQDASLLSLFKGIKYLLQLDRRNKRDCVFYNAESREFRKYITSFGWKGATGSFSDISILSPVLNLCGVNVSVGFQNEHTPRELIRLDWLSQSTGRVLRMIQDSYSTKVWRLSENQEDIYLYKRYPLWYF